MPCLICGNEKTIEAHLIPRAFATEVASSRGEKHVIAYKTQERFRKTNSGIYDTEILCGPCDGLLGKHEAYVIEILRKARGYLSPSGKILCAKPADGNAFVKFAAGISWKYAATRVSNGRIEIGPYRESLADVAFERSDIPASVDVCAMQLHTGTDEVYFYRAPMLDRKEGVNVVRFCVGGFIFFLKVDKRPNLSIPPAECWLRGKHEVAFPVLPATMFEEWTLHGEIAGRPNLKAYFDRMRKSQMSV